MDSYESQDRLIVGVDFGTTFSGVAFALSSASEPLKAVDVITSWPGTNAITSDKVPTEIKYDDNGECRWGFQIRPEEARLRCIKLLIDFRQKLPSYVSAPDTYEMLLRYDRNSKDVIEDYLTAIHQHTLDTLKSRYGSQFLKTTALDFVLTVPAVWSDAAKAATEKAAAKAGMAKARLISEPEAAAVYTLQTIQPNHLREGNNFIVCDAGGGTVDLISFEIKQLEPLRLEETVEGDGGMCGAAFLNIRFEQSIRSKMGEVKFESMISSPRGNRSWQIALNYFEERVKRRFDNDGATKFNIPLPGAADDAMAGIDFGFVTLTNAEVEAIFEPVIVEIINLVQEQMNRILAVGKSVNGILLVGGFGQSAYVAKRLKQHFLGEMPSQMGSGASKMSATTTFDIMQPPNAWTAVVRGAVLRGIEGNEFLLRRRSRRHYGIEYNAVFEPKNHPESCKYFDTLEGIWRVESCLEWSIHKGQHLASDTTILFPLEHTSPSGYDKSIDLELFVCEDEIAPKGLHTSREKEATRVLCKLPVTLETVPVHLWEPRVGKTGVHYRVLPFQVGMRVDSGGLHFDLRVNNVVYGEMVAEFE